MTRRGGAIAFVMLALACVAFGIWDVNQPVGQGEVSAILHGLGLFLGLIFGAIFLGIAGWIGWWHVRWVKVTGAVVFIGLGVFLFVSVIAIFGEDWKYAWERRQAIRAGHAHLEEVSDATLAALVSQRPDLPEALALGEALRSAVYRDVYAGLMLENTSYQRARRLWTIYLAVFFGEADPMREALPPTAAECDEFTTLFAARFDPAVHQARFDEMCG